MVQSVHEEVTMSRHRTKHQRSTLYTHQLHPHIPQNTHQTQRVTLQHDGNMRMAVWLTKRVGSMWTAYLFVVLAFVGLLAILGIMPPIAALLVAWTSQTFIQLVLLPIIMVGQNVLDQQNGLQAEEQFHTTTKIYHDSEQIMRHLSAQDAELIKQSHALTVMCANIASILALANLPSKEASV